MEERKKGENEKFCSECGEAIRLKAEICPKCGVRQLMSPVKDQRSKSTAGLLGLFLGGLGIHKFYMGKPMWGLIYILLCWTFVPAIIGFIEGLNYLTMSNEIFLKRHSGTAWGA